MRIITAYEIPNLRFSGIAVEAIPRRRFVKANLNGEFIVAVAGDGAVVGASMNDPAANEVLEIADGIVMVEAGGAIVAGTEVQCGANGTVITLAAGAKVGTALSGGAAGVLITVKTSV